MTRAAQMGHVLRKDLRQLRWLLLLYVALVAAAVANATATGVFQETLFGAAGGLAAAVGALLVAIAVLGDSPIRDDAFWKTQPFAPLSIAGAKLALLLLLLAIGVLGQVVAVLSYDVHDARLLHATTSPALLYGMLLVGGALVAALTEDLRAFLIAVIAIPVAGLLLTILVASRDRSATLPAAAGAACTALAVIGAVMVVVLAYRMCDRTRALRVAGLLVLGCAFLSTCSSDTHPPRDAFAELPVTGTRLELSAGAEPSVSTDRHTIDVDILVPPFAPGQRAELWQGSIVLALRSGDSLRLPLRSGMLNAPWQTTNEPRIVAIEDGLASEGAAISLGNAPPALHGVRWLARSPAPRHLAVTAPLTDSALAALRGGIGSVAVQGRVVLMNGVPWWRMPMADGARLTRDGMRARVAAVKDGRAGRMLLSIGRIERERWFGAPLASMPHDDELAVVDEARGEGVITRRLEYGFGSEMLVLPGSVLTVRTSLLSAQPAARAGRAGDARVAPQTLVGLRYIPYGWYPLDLTVSAPPVTPAAAQRQPSESSRSAPRP